jgi:hypothetical protein
MQLVDRNSIANRITDGTLTFESVEDFENTLAIFPYHPGVHRAYGDMLAHTGSLDAAAKAYEKACRLFVKQGMMLQAIVAKILEWRLVRPSHEKARRFHRTLKQISSEDSPLKNFITAMRYPEMIAFMMNLVRVRLPARKRVKAFGESEDHLYFVVSGVLKETDRSPSDGNDARGEERTTDLVENVVFGDVYPFEEERKSTTDVETVTHSELVKISANRLKSMCNDHPNMEILFKTLYEANKRSRQPSSASTIRKATRHQLPTKANMKIFAESPGSTPVVVDGFTEDISLGGTCFVVEDTYRVGPPAELVHKNVKLRVSLPKAEETLSILGTIVWGKHVSNEDGTNVALGIQFVELDDHTRAKLNEYCSGSDGEQNLILSLWESYMRP